MIELSELSVFEDIIFSNNFSTYKPQLINFFNTIFSYNNNFNDDTKLKFKENYDKHNSHFAEDILFSETFEIIHSKINKESLFFNEDKWIKLIPDIKEKISYYLGLDFKSREIKFVDKYPKGHETHEEKGSSCITIFEGQENPGIYFLKKKLSNITSAIHIIHEQIHTCLSQNKDKEQYFCEWFEEGLAMFLSMKIYYDLTNDLETIKSYRERSFCFNKIKPQWDFAKQYFEYMKLFPSIFYSKTQSDFKALIKSYITSDRDKIKDVLRETLNNNMKLTTDNIIDTFLLNYSNYFESEILNPLEFIALKIINENYFEAEQLIKKLNAPEEIVNNIINSLFGKQFIIINKDKKLEIQWKKQHMLDLNQIKSYFIVKND